MNNNTQLSPVIAGCMNWGQWGEKFTTSKYLQLTEECIAAGISTFDHADIYGGYTTEAEFGAALNENPSLRSKMQLITKCGIKMMSAERPNHLIKSYDTSAKHILHSTEQSLKNLATDYLDILLIHRPDPLLHPDEIAEAFTLLKKQGKVLHFGVSNFTASQTALVHSRYPVEYNQLEISILKIDALYNGQLDQCIELGIRPMAWSPLASGQLVKNITDEKNKRIMAVAGRLAQKYNRNADQILLCFLLMHPSGIIPVIGSTKKERIIAALEATSFTIDREEWFMLWQAAAGHEVA